MTVFLPQRFSGTGAGGKDPRIRCHVRRNRWIDVAHSATFGARGGPGRLFGAGPAGDGPPGPKPARRLFGAGACGRVLRSVAVGGCRHAHPGNRRLFGAVEAAVPWGRCHRGGSLSARCRAQRFLRRPMRIARFFGTGAGAQPLGVGAQAERSPGTELPAGWLFGARTRASRSFGAGALGLQRLRAKWSWKASGSIRSGAMQGPRLST